VCQNEVVSEVGGIAGPGDEMVDLCLLGKWLLAVEANSLLHVQQDGPIRIQAGPLLAEQEGSEVGGITEPPVSIELLDESHPRAFDQVTDQFVEGSEAIGDTGLQCDPVSPV